MFNTVFEKHAPLKKKYARANHSKFVTKKLSRAIKLRSKLRKMFVKDRTRIEVRIQKTKKCLCIFILKSQKRLL